MWIQLPVKTANDLNYLGQDETTPGGTSVVFLANNLLKLQAGAKLEEEKDFGIKGFKVTAQYLKSRSNESGRKFELIFSQSKGFDNFYTNFNYLKAEKYLRGSGLAYYFDFDPNTKFKQKNAKELYLSNSEWAKGFDELVEDAYYNFITTGIDNSSEEELELVECVDKKKKIWLGNDDNYYYKDGTPALDYEE